MGAYPGVGVFPGYYGIIQMSVASKLLWNEDRGPKNIQNAGIKLTTRHPCIFNKVENYLQLEISVSQLLV